MNLLRVLIVEDSEDDALLMLHELRQGGWAIAPSGGSRPG